MLLLLSLVASGRGGYLLGSPMTRPGLFVGGEGRPMRRGPSPRSPRKASPLLAASRPRTMGWGSATWKGTWRRRWSSRRPRPRFCGRRQESWPWTGRYSNSPGRI